MSSQSPERSVAELERLAFGPAVDEAERAEAERRLAELAEAEAARVEAERLAAEDAQRRERVAQWHPTADPRLLRHAMRLRESRPAQTLLAGALALAVVAVAWWGYASQLRGSLAVFERPMSSRDESAPGWLFGMVLPVEETVAVRWIGTNSRYNLYAVLGADGDVCIAVVEPDVGGTSECTTAEAFAEEGIRIEGSIAGRPYAVEWGPRGTPRWENASVLSS